MGAFVAVELVDDDPPREAVGKPLIGWDATISRITSSVAGIVLPAEPRSRAAGGYIDVDVDVVEWGRLSSAI